MITKLIHDDREWYRQRCMRYEAALRDIEERYELHRLKIKRVTRRELVTYAKQALYGKEPIIK